MVTKKTKTARVNVRLLARATELARTVRPEATQSDVLEWALESLCARIYMDERNAARQYELWHLAQSRASRYRETLEHLRDTIDIDLNLPPMGSEEEES